MKVGTAAALDKEQTNGIECNRGKTSDGWGAYAPDLDAAIIALGDTREEAIQDFRNALLDIFDLRREEGRDVPNITVLEIRETRAVETLETLAA